MKELFFTTVFLVSVTVISLSCSNSHQQYIENNKINSNARIINKQRAKPTPIKQYYVFGKKYTVLQSAKGYKRKGIASWYGPGFDGKKTASGETYNMFSMTAASKELPIPCTVRVRNLENGKSVIVRVNDRGPFVKNRIMDLSYAAAKKLGFARKGTATVEIEAITP